MEINIYSVIIFIVIIVVLLSVVQGLSGVSGQPPESRDLVHLKPFNCNASAIMGSNSIESNDSSSESSKSIFKIT